MKYGYCTTREERRKYYSELANKFREYRMMNYDQLRDAVKEKFPGIDILQSDREELIQFLVMDYVEKMI